MGLGLGLGFGGVDEGGSGWEMVLPGSDCLGIGSRGLSGEEDVASAIDINQS